MGVVWHLHCCVYNSPFQSKWFQGSPQTAFGKVICSPKQCLGGHAHFGQTCTCPQVAWHYMYDFILVVVLCIAKYIINMLIAIKIGRAQSPSHARRGISIAKAVWKLGISFSEFNSQWASVCCRPLLAPSSTSQCIIYCKQAETREVT